MFGTAFRLHLQIGIASAGRCKECLLRMSHTFVERPFFMFVNCTKSRINKIYHSSEETVVEVKIYSYDIC